MAYACVVEVEGRDLDFFRRHPSLWQGRFIAGAPTWVAFSREGIPILGRALAKGEARPRPAANHALLKTGRDWSKPARLETLLDNLAVSPTRPPKHPVRAGEVG